MYVVEDLRSEVEQIARAVPAYNESDGEVAEIVSSFRLAGDLEEVLCRLNVCVGHDLPFGEMAIYLRLKSVRPLERVIRNISRKMGLCDARQCRKHV